MLHKSLNYQETMIILNPSCSELVCSVQIETHKELLEVIDELSRVTTVAVYLAIGYEWTECDPVYLDKIEDPDGITRLSFLPFDQHGSFVEISAKIPVPLSYIELEDNVLNYNPEKADVLFKDVKLSLRNVLWNKVKPWVKQMAKKDRSGEHSYLWYDEARLDLSLLSRPKGWKGSYYIAFEVGDLELFYDSKNYKDYLGSSAIDGSLVAIVEDFSYELFPCMQKIYELLPPKFIRKVSTYNTGKIEVWEKWLAINSLL